MPVARSGDAPVVAPEVVGEVSPGEPLGFTPREAVPAEAGAEGLVALDPGPDEAGAEGLVVNPDPGREDGTADGFGKAVDDPEPSPPEERDRGRSSGSSNSRRSDWDSVAAVSLSSVAGW